MPKIRAFRFTHSQSSRQKLDRNEVTTGGGVMGHVRLGKPPATRKWRQVVELLGAEELVVADIAAAVQRSADLSLATAVRDPGFVESFWMLLKLPEALASEDPQDALATLGIRIPPDAGVADLTAGFEEVFERRRQRCLVGFSDFAFIARNAAIAAIAGLAHEHGPKLWRPTAEDERSTIASFASTKRFGELAQTFFTNVLRGHIRYFLDRELPRHIGAGGALASVADAEYFDEAIRRHCRETTIIMRAFSQDWLGKNRFHLGKDLTRQDAAALADFAFTKIRNELNNRSGASAA